MDAMDAIQKKDEFDYRLHIAETDRQLDEIETRKQMMARSIEHLKDELEAGLNQLKILNEELAEQGNKNALENLKNEYAKANYFSEILEEDQREIMNELNKETERLLRSRSEVQKKREAI